LPQGDQWLKRGGADLSNGGVKAAEANRGREGAVVLHAARNGGTARLTAHATSRGILNAVEISRSKESTLSEEVLVFHDYG
jgi:hypothetical protein